ncbi:hypothetical protein IV203_002638 [Nitzschia inconspicua]|uniref:Uncharacterized protein n=1 Tax=Nitzschia inconspicua TaxID=303405 RepID=A0A9K3PBF8_9STRA|nr:hypothetical protein IV203_002638 [Nitzschia inconspicua]
MGKKKSKISKQKQAKAKQRHASLGGVTVTKGSSSKFQQSRLQSHHQQATSIILPSNNNKKNTSSSNTPQAQSASHMINRKELIKQLSQKNAQPKVFFSQASSSKIASTSASRVSLQPRLGSIREDQEQQDFDQQLASLHERQWVAEHKLNGGKKRASKMTGNNTSNNAGAAANGVFGNLAMQPASFRVEKDTQDLLQETMQKMVHMTGVGISAFETTPIRSNKAVEPPFNGFSLPTPPHSTFAQSSSGITSQSTVSSLAVAAQRQLEERTRFIQEHSSQNHYAALEMGDSDEEDEADHSISNNDWSLKIEPPLGMNFTAASFSLMPRQTPTPASTPTTVTDSH